MVAAKVDIISNISPSLPPSYPWSCWFALNGWEGVERLGDRQRLRKSGNVV